MQIDRDTLYTFCDELRVARRALQLVQISVVRLIRENIRLREELKRFVRGAGYRPTEGRN